MEMVENTLPNLCMKEIMASKDFQDMACNLSNVLIYGDNSAKEENIENHIAKYFGKVLPLDQRDSSSDESPVTENTTDNVVMEDDKSSERVKSPLLDTLCQSFGIAVPKNTEYRVSRISLGSQIAVSFASSGSIHRNKFNKMLREGFSVEFYPIIDEKDSPILLLLTFSRDDSK